MHLFNLTLLFLEPVPGTTLTKRSYTAIHSLVQMFVKPRARHRICTAIVDCPNESDESYLIYPI